MMNNANPKFLACSARRNSVAKKNTAAVNAKDANKSKRKYRKNAFFTKKSNRSAHPVRQMTRTLTRTRKSGR